MAYLPQISSTSSRRMFMFIILSSAPARGAVFGSYNDWRQYLRQVEERSACKPY